MFKIGDFSKICRIPVSALRYYADIGLLEPARVDAYTSYRYYSLEQLPRLNRILALKDLGLSLEQIDLVLREYLSAEELRGMLRLKTAEIRQNIADQQAQLVRVEARLAQIEQEEVMPELEVVLKAIEPQRVLYIRENAPQPSYVGTLIGESYAGMTSRGVEPAGPPVAIFYDDEFKPENLDVEVAFPVEKSVAGEVPLPNGRRLVLHELPAMEQAACTIHNGPYHSLPETYGALGKWIERNGLQFAGPSREVYLTAPDENGSAMTEIQWPVARG